MKSDNYFRNALKYKMQEKKIRQKDIADALSFRGTQLSEYLSEKRGFSEHRKELLSAFLGLTYIEMLLLGKKIVEGGSLDFFNSEIKNKQTEDSLYLKEILEETKWLNESLVADLERKKEDIQELRNEKDELKKEIEQLNLELGEYKTKFKKDAS